MFDQSFASTDSGKFNSTRVEFAAVSLLTILLRIYVLWEQILGVIHT